uniref:Uncharacterized protein n=1 Tax=Kalanchoe fedtschenkoi TaxID=63787 RepID=A0A7N0R8W6_KALFE
MAPSSARVLLVIILILTFSAAFGVESSSEDAAFAPDSFLRIELDQLRSSISTLETRIRARVEELKSKDDNIKRMEENIQGKTDYSASLNIQIEALQKRSQETEKLKTKINARSSERSSQIGSLKKELEAQEKKKDDLEVRRYTAEEKIRELHLKLESLQKISDEQRTRMSKIKHDIQFAEENLMRLKLEASLVSEEMNQSYTITFWTDYGRSSLDWTIQSASDMKGIVQEWADPHIKAVEKLTKDLSGMFFHAIKVEHLKTCITRFSVTTQPHFDKLRASLRPYTREIVRTYRRLMRSVTTRHTQVQHMVLELLEGHEYSRQFADKGIVWYLASVIFALPAILIVNLYTTIGCYKPQKPRRKQYNARRRAKRTDSGN